MADKSCNAKIEWLKNCSEQLNKKEILDKSALADAPGIGLKVLVRELDDVLLKDSGNKIKDSNKWPLVIDQFELASAFLRYTDTNYIDALNPSQMEPDQIRLAILGSLRYGRPLVLDMMEADMFDAAKLRFDEVQKDLMDAIMNKSILTEAVYGGLIRATDGEEYKKNKFTDSSINKFKFIILTKNPSPSQQLVSQTFPITVVTPAAK